MKENQVDLFEEYDSLPNEVRAIVDTIEQSYQGLLESKRKLNKIGYSFELGLDAVPYNLRKI